MEQMKGCYGCIWYDNDSNYSEIFGESPNCKHDPRPKNIDGVMDNEEFCEYKMVDNYD